MRRILCALTLAAYPIGGVLADAQTSAAEIAVHGSHNAKITLVYEHELPNVPGKSVKGVLVEYGPGGSSVAHTTPRPRSFTRPSSRARSSARSTTGRRRCTGPARAGPSPAIVMLSAGMQARPSRRASAVFVLDTGETDLVLPY